MKLEAGKYFRTRDGRKAYVAAILPDNPLGANTKYSVVGFVGHNRHSWLTGGRSESGGQCCDDLVAEWREPSDVPTTIVLFRTSYGEMVVLREAEVRLFGHYKGWTEVARKTITITEGEGME